MPAGDLNPRPLGSSGMAVSALSLGSWRTFERLPPETGVAILRAARDEGITFFDDARYNDETGQAPIPTGYSEVLFGELFRGAGLRRDETVVANKLWWEFWPGQSAAAELDASLQRMGFDHVDLIYANPPPAGLEVADLVAGVGALVAAGKARAWGLVNWPADLCGQAVEAAAGLAIAPPCAIQLPYSLVQRSWVEDAAMNQAISRARCRGRGLVLPGGGALTGKYRAGPAAGALAGTLTEPRFAPAIAAAGELAAPGRIPAHDPGSAGAGVPVHQPGRRQRAVRRHQRGAAPGQLRRGRPVGPAGPGRHCRAAADRAPRRDRAGLTPGRVRGRVRPPPAGPAVRPRAWPPTSAGTSQAPPGGAAGPSGSRP